MTCQAGRSTLSARQIFFWPLVVNGICLSGLVSALIGDGWLDLLSWVCLGESVALIVYAYLGMLRRAVLDKGRVNAVAHVHRLWPAWLIYRSTPLPPVSCQRDMVQ